MHSGCTPGTVRRPTAGLQCCDALCGVCTSRPPMASHRRCVRACAPSRRAPWAWRRLRDSGDLTCVATGCALKYANSAWSWFVTAPTALTPTGARRMRRKGAKSTVATAIRGSALSPRQAIKQSPSLPVCAMLQSVREEIAKTAPSEGRPCGFQASEDSHSTGSCLPTAQPGTARKSSKSYLVAPQHTHFLAPSWKTGASVWYTQQPSTLLSIR